MLFSLGMHLWYSWIQRGLRAQRHTADSIAEHRCALTWLGSKKARWVGKHVVGAPFQNEFVSNALFAEFVVGLFNHGYGCNLATSSIHIKITNIVWRRLYMRIGTRAFCLKCFSFRLLIHIVTWTLPKGRGGTSTDSLAEFYLCADWPSKKTYEVQTQV